MTDASVTKSALEPSASKLYTSTLSAEKDLSKQSKQKRLSQKKREKICVILLSGIA